MELYSKSGYGSEYAGPWEWLVAGFPLAEWSMEVIDMSVSFIP